MLKQQGFAENFMQGSEHVVQWVVSPRASDLGNGFMVQRALPSARCRKVGPFVFLDQMGPADLAPGEGLDVPPHPHIGLATVTYLFDGELQHRDSLGVVQLIRPGEVNWMTAGRGIVHSERSPSHEREMQASLFGIQAWIALAAENEECDPAFEHYASNALPFTENDGVTVRLIAGELFGMRAPVGSSTRLFYADVSLQARGVIAMPDDAERAVYIVEGAVAIQGKRYEAGQLLVFRPDHDVRVEAADGRARLMMLGGEPVTERFVWWNFVSSSRERIERAKTDWREGRFPPVPGETESIPLPEKRKSSVRYP